MNAAKDIATHAVEKAADIVGDGGQIIKGDVAGGVGAFVEDASYIVTHAVDKAKEAFTGQIA